jgi:hypothetical protein
VDAPYELNGISAAAGCETTPEVSFKVHAEGSGIISAMERTGAGELSVSHLEMRIKSVGGKDLADGDTVFEKAKAIGIHSLPPLRTGLMGAGLSGVEFKEELLVQLSELSLGGGFQELCSHQIEHP